MIVVTGGCGFIGSNLVKYLNSLKKKNILIVDSITKKKKKNLKELKYKKIENKEIFLKKLSNGNYNNKINVIFHYGACSDTTNTNWKYLYKNNYVYSKKLIKFAINNKIKILYASSASIYGLNANNQKESSLNHKPINYYAKSKFLVDKFAKEMKSKYVIGLRFFNVYGKNETHKMKMMSPITKFYLDIKSKKKCKIFGKYGGYKKGEHSRDFIYVEDCNKIAIWLLKKDVYGIFNVGTGKSIKFIDVANSIIKKIGYGKIEFVNFPKNLKKKYQCYTKANMNKLLNKGFNQKFCSVEDALKKINF